MRIILSILVRVCVCTVRVWIVCFGKSHDCVCVCVCVFEVVWSGMEIIMIATFTPFLRYLPTNDKNQKHKSEI